MLLGGQVKVDSPSLIEVCDDAVDSLSVRLCLEGGWVDLSDE